MTKRGNLPEVTTLRSLVHNLMQNAKQLKQKKDEEEDQSMRKRLKMSNAEIREVMDGLISKKDECGAGVDLVGANLKWTQEEEKLLSIRHDHKWDSMYDVICFVWAHFLKVLEDVDNDTYVRELAEVWRLMKVFHHKMRTNDTRSICIVPSYLDVENRIHFNTNEDISAIHQSPFNALERPRRPAYKTARENNVDDSFASSMTSEGVTSDESF